MYIVKHLETAFNVEHMPLIQNLKKLLWVFSTGMGGRNRGVLMKTEDASQYKKHVYETANFKIVAVSLKVFL